MLQAYAHWQSARSEHYETIRTTAETVGSQLLRRRSSSTSTNTQSEALQDLNLVESAVYAAVYRDER